MIGTRDLCPRILGWRGAASCQQRQTDCVVTLSCRVNRDAANRPQSSRDRSERASSNAV